MMKFFLNTTNVLLLVVIVLVLLVLYQARVYHTGEPEPPEPPVVTGVCDAANVAAGAAGCPLLTAENIFGNYLGAARAPEDDICNGNNGFAYYQYGGMAYASPTSFYVTNGYCFAEVTIPALIKGVAETSALNKFTFAQPWFLSDAIYGGFYGDIDAAKSTGFNFGGLLKYGEYLYVGGYGFYGSQAAPHDKSWFRLHPQLASNGTSYPGAVEVWHATPGVINTTQGFVGGYAATVPPEWQAAIGGPAVVGGQCMSIVTRTSNGPSLVAINPADINVHTPVPGTALMYELGGEWGDYNGATPLWGGTGCIGGMAIIPGTRTVVFIGWNGTGEFCYGPACHDPEFPGVEGQHAYPYNYQYWLVDLKDLALVKAGKKAVTSVLPYAYGPITVPFAHDVTKIRGVYLDPGNLKLYFLQARATPMTPGYRFHPVLHGYQIVIPSATKTR